MQKTDSSKTTTDYEDLPPKTSRNTIHIGSSKNPRSKSINMYALTAFEKLVDRQEGVVYFETLGNANYRTVDAAEILKRILPVKVVYSGFGTVKFVKPEPEKNKKRTRNVSRFILGVSANEKHEFRNEFLPDETIEL